MANLLTGCYLIIASVAAALLIISFSSNNWRWYSILLVEYTEGLFKRCAYVKLLGFCSSLHDGLSKVPRTLAGTIALMALAIAFAILSAVIKFVGSIMEKRGVVGVLALQILAVTSGVTGLLMYTTEYLQGLMKAGWSYILAWVGVGLLALDIILLLLIAIRG